MDDLSSKVPGVRYEMNERYKNNATNGMSHSAFDARNLFNNDSFTDVIIRYAGKEIKAHRAILCTRSEYFSKILSPTAQQQETKLAIVKLDEDNEQALEDMLRWLYSYEYFSTFDFEIIKDLDDDQWERHLEALIVADKYGVSSMEEHAMHACEVIFGTFANDIDLLKLVERALRYPDRQGKLAGSIAWLSESRFLKVFKDANFRVWLEKHSAIKERLIDQNFSELIKTTEFREYLRTDSDTALRHIDRLMGPDEGKKTEEKKKKKRKVSPQEG